MLTFSVASYTGVESMCFLKFWHVLRLKFRVIIDQDTIHHISANHHLHCPHSAAFPVSKTFIKCSLLYTGKGSFEIAMIAKVY